jgi:hypothetical protein
MKFKIAALLAVLGLVIQIIIPIFLISEDMDLIEFISENQWFSLLVLLFPLGMLILLGEINLGKEKGLALPSFLAAIGITYNLTILVYSSGGGENVSRLILDNAWLGWIGLIYPLFMLFFFISLSMSKFRYLSVGIYAAIVGSAWQLIETVLVLTKNREIINFFFREKAGYLLFTLPMPLLFLVFFITVLMYEHK